MSFIKQFCQKISENKQKDSEAEECFFDKFNYILSTFNFKTFKIAFVMLIARWA